ASVGRADVPRDPWGKRPPRRLHFSVVDCHLDQFWHAELPTFDALRFPQGILTQPRTTVLSHKSYKRPHPEAPANRTQVFAIEFVLRFGKHVVPQRCITAEMGEAIY